MIKLSDIISNALNEGIHDKYIFKAIFIVGSPGAGKSTAIDKLGITSLGLKLLDPDVATVNKLKKMNVDLKYDPSKEKEWDIAHNHGIEIDKKFRQIYVSGMLGLIISGTGSKIDKLLSVKNELDDIGYQTYIIFINCDLPTALKRNKMRDRSLNDEVVIEKHAQYMKNIGEFQKAFGRDNFIIIDTTDPNALSKNINYYYNQVLKWLKAPISRKASAILQKLKNKK